MKKQDCQCKELGIGSKIWKSTSWLCDHNRLTNICYLISNYWSKKKDTNKSQPEDMAFMSNKKCWLTCQNCGKDSPKVISELSRAKSVSSHFFKCDHCKHRHPLTIVETCSCEKEGKIIIRDGAKICEHNNLLTRCPPIIHFWSKNNLFLPHQTAPYTTKPIYLLCPVCNEESTATSAPTLSRSGYYECKNCYLLGNNTAKLYPHLIEEVNDKTDLSQYSYASGKIVEWKCKRINRKGQPCNHIWSTFIFTRTVDNKSCPICNKGSSKGNEETGKILDILDIEYEREKPFETLIHISGLAVDFYIDDPKFNKVDLKTGESKESIIEYDGSIHFENGFRHDKRDHFRDRVWKDIIKDQWCINHEVNMIRIPYTKFKEIEIVLRWFIENKDKLPDHFICTYPHYAQYLKYDPNKVSVIIIESPPLKYDLPEIK